MTKKKDKTRKWKKGQLKVECYYFDMEKCKKL